MKAGVMPPPGLYAGMFGWGNFADELVGPDKNVIEGPELDQYAFGPLVQYVSNLCIFGANYGALVAVPFANTSIDFPRLDVDDSTGTAMSQLWVIPVMLGWHITDPLPLAPGGADMTFHYAFYAPTGRYNVILTDTGLSPAPNNTALGMWTNELSFRVTGYFDKARKWHGTGSLFYDFNSKKKDLDWKTGNPFTYMWGLGRDYGKPGSMFSGWVGRRGLRAVAGHLDHGHRRAADRPREQDPDCRRGPGVHHAPGRAHHSLLLAVRRQVHDAGPGCLRAVRDAAAVLSGNSRSSCS